MPIPISLPEAADAEFPDLETRNPGSTHLSLLDDLKDPAQRDLAWQQFVARYTRLIRFWCGKWGVELHEKDDVIQDTVVRVLGSISDFERIGSGSFRAWLRKLAHNSYIQITRDNLRARAELNPDVVQAASWKRLASSSAEDHLRQLFDAWAAREILDLAHLKASQRALPETWEVYRLIVLEQQPIDEVVTQLGITHGLIYNRVFRLRKLVREELDRIEGRQANPGQRTDAEG